jgi:hypothetical protein
MQRGWPQSAADRSCSPTSPRQPSGNHRTLETSSVKMKPWLQDAAEPLKARAAQVGWARTVERDFQRSMESVRAASPRTIVLEHWPGVGPVDLTADGGVAVELKWCKSGDGLCNGAWDIAKLATLLAERRADGAWIAAGAPVEHWAQSRGRCRTLRAGDVRRRRARQALRELVALLVQGRRDASNAPPNGFAVSRRIAIPVTLDRKPFELRAARIDLTDSCWRPHICPHSWRQEACRRRS